MISYCSEKIFFRVYNSACVCVCDKVPKYFRALMDGSKVSLLIYYLRSVDNWMVFVFVAARSDVTQDH